MANTTASNVGKAQRVVDELRKAKAMAEKPESEKAYQSYPDGRYISIAHSKPAFASRCALVEFITDQTGQRWYRYGGESSVWQLDIDEFVRRGTIVRVESP